MYQLAPPDADIDLRRCATPIVTGDTLEHGFGAGAAAAISDTPLHHAPKAHPSRRPLQGTGPGAGGGM